jgi:hypothetical protein
VITLDAAGTLRAVAGTATALTMTVFGDELSSSGNSFKKLYQGQVAASVTTVYTVPASTQALIRTILVVNTTGSAVTFGLYTDGTAAANKISAFTIPANGEAVYSSRGWQVLNAAGALVTGVVDATDVTFTPTGNIAATNVQSAIAEVDSETDARLDSIESAMADSGWVTVTTRGGFTVQSTPQVRKVGNLVYCRGGWSSAGLAINTNYTVADVPVGYAPPGDAYFRATTASGVANGQIFVRAARNIDLRVGSNVGSYFLMSTCVWFVDS